MIHMSGIGLYFQIFNLERIWRVKATFYSNTYIQLGFIETCSVATKKKSVFMHWKWQNGKWKRHEVVQKNKAFYCVAETFPLNDILKSNNVNINQCWLVERWNNVGHQIEQYEHQ